MDFISDLIRNKTPFLNKTPSYMNYINTLPNSIVNMPTKFNQNDSSTLIKVYNSGLTVKYIGPGRDDNDAAAIRTDNPIPSSIGLFYYEITITNKGEEGFISIGLAQSTTILNRLTGWEIGSVGYHGDDGMIYEGSGTGSSFGPTFTLGDVVGCGINFHSKCIIFTKNGIKVGSTPYPLQKIEGGVWFPSVGLRTVNEEIKANFFGPFSYDIDYYLNEFRILTNMSYLTKWKMNSAPSEIHQLVLYYLLDNGFENSAKAFYDIQKSIVNHPHTELYNSEFKRGLDLNIINEILSMSKIRAHLCDLITRGSIREFMDEIGLCYPELLKDHELLFLVNAQLFIEMIRNSAAINEILALGMEIQQRLLLLQQEESEIDKREDGNGNGNKMEISGMLKGGGIGTSKSEKDIQTNYLEELYALIAYKDPLQSPLAYLFDQDQRLKLVDAFERSLQKIDKGKKEDPLQLSWKQLKLINNILLEKGNPESAFVWML